MSTLSKTILATSGLVGYWPLLEPTGTTAYDFGPNRINGTYSASPSRIPAPNGDQIANFGGGQVTIADNANWSTAAGASGKQSWEALVTQHSLYSGNFAPIVAKCSPGGGFEWTMGVGSTNLVFMQTCDSGGSNNNTSMATSFTLDQWYHVCGTFDKTANTQLLYINGVQVATSATSFTVVDGTSSVIIGYRGDSPTYHWSGGIGHVAMYNRVLSPAEVLAHAQAAMNPAPDATGSGLMRQILALNPAGYWPLNETTGSTAFDRSGNGRNGTYTNGVLLSGGGAQFDGASGYVEVADNNAWDRGTAWSIFMCIYMNSGQTLPIGPFCKGQSSSACEMWLEFENYGSVYGTNAIAFNFTSNPSSNNEKGWDLGDGSALLTNRWIDVLFTWNNSTVTGYLNGVAAGSDASQAGTYAPSTGTLRFGQSLLNRCMAGLLRDVAIFNSTLTATDAALLHSTALRSGVVTG